MSRNLRPLPVSTRLRTPRSPVEPRHKAWKHVSARPKRATSRRTVTYAEVSEDEEDEEEGDDQEDHEDEDEESDLSSSSGTSVSDSDQHSFFSSLSSHKDLTEDDSEDIIAVAPTPVAKMKSRFPPNIAQGRKQQSTLLFSTSKPMSGSQMRNKKKLSLLVKLNIHHTQSQSPTTGRGNPFNKLSIELLQHISTFISSDKDVVKYRHTCRVTLTSITSSVWRKRFLVRFDEIPGLEVDEVAQLYKERSRLLTAPPFFDRKRYGDSLTGSEEAVVAMVEQKFLDLLRELLLQSKNYSTVNADGNIIVQGKNHQAILDMLCTDDEKLYVDIADALFCTSWDDKTKSLDKWTKVSHSNELVHILQVCLAQYYLGKKTTKSGRFESSQFHVYSHVQPMFLDSKNHINARLLLHIINFFRFHLNEDEGLLIDEYPYLHPEHLPHPGIGAIKDGVQPLGRHWKGVFTMLTEPDLAKLRSWNGGKHVFTQDHHNEIDAFQDISFFFDRTQKLPWSKKWEDLLHSSVFKNPSSSSAFEPQIEEFWGTSRKGNVEGRNGHFFGRLQSMPPQQGVYGFQRITFMKFETVDINGVDTYDGSTAYAYEGCVFPGSTVIAGRWWTRIAEWKSEGSYGGPFMWWNVESPSEAPIKPEEALEFLDTFGDQALGLH